MFASRLGLPVLISTLALVVMAVSMLVQAGAPIHSGDAWWHLSWGEAFWTHGPWLVSDPLLFTALLPPSPHSWFFDLSLSGIESLFGLAGLRATHALASLGVLILAYRIFATGARGAPFVVTATALFLALAFDRLERLRPDLVSISAALLLYQLLLADDEPPSTGRVVAGALLISFWANFHALFALGPLLLVVALGGWLVTPLLERRRGFLPIEQLRLKRLGSALGLGLVGSLLNPRGIDQHLSFFRSSEGDALSVIADDWTPFDPFSWDAMRGTMTLSTWVVADVVLGGFLLVAVYCFVRLLRDPETLKRESIRAPLLGMAAASLVAILASSRFLWMAFFPLLWLVRSVPAVLPRGSQTGAAWCAAAVCASVMAFFPSFAELRKVDADWLGAYVQRNVDASYPIASVEFLSSVGLEGNLYARYASSGFLGHWLKPGIKTLVNGSMNFPRDVFVDYFAVSNNQGAVPAERFPDVLDRREVDLYLGVGTPTADASFYNTADLEAAPGWLLIHRGIDQAIYLRRTPGNRENLKRVASYYAQQNIPFDPESGLDVAAILRDHTRWAIDQRMLPVNYRELVSVGSPQALNHLAVVHLLLGDYSAQTAFDEQLIAFAPKLRPARRRLVYGLMKQDRIEEAVAHSQKFPARGEHRIADALTTLLQQRIGLDRDSSREPPSPSAMDAWRKQMNSLDLVRNGELHSVEQSLVSPPTLAASRRGEPDLR